MNRRQDIKVRDTLFAFSVAMLIMPLLTFADFVEIDVFEEFPLSFNLHQPDGHGEALNLVGPMTQHVFFEPDEGAAQDDSGNGLDEVQTEIVELSLRGDSSLGPVSVQLPAGAPPSLGEIEEQVNNVPGLLDLPPFTAAGVADSFFDIYVELDIPDVGLLSILQPLTYRALITHKPPGPRDLFVCITPDPVELFDAAGNPSGFFISCETLPVEDEIFKNGFEERELDEQK